MQMDAVESPNLTHFGRFCMSSSQKESAPGPRAPGALAIGVWHLDFVIQLKHYAMIVVIDVIAHRPGRGGRR